MRVGLRTSWQAVQLRTTAFLLPARGLVRGRRGRARMSVRLVWLPDGSGDGGGIGGGASRLIFIARRRDGARAAKHFVEPLGVNLAAEKIGFIKDAAEKTDVGLDASDGVLLEGAAKAGNGFFAAIAPGDELTEKRIVIVGHGPALVDAVVHSNARAAGNLARNNFSRRGEKIIVGILGGKTDFHGVATRRDGFPPEGQPGAAGESRLEFYEVEAGNLVGDGMCEPQPRVHYPHMKH